MDGPLLVNAQITSDIFQECIQYTKQFGSPETEGFLIKNVSHMENILELGDKALFMKTSQIFICLNDDDQINGIMPVLYFDKERDLEKNFYEKYSNDLDWIGTMTDNCDIVVLQTGDKIKSVRIYHSDGVIRTLKFNISNQPVKVIGTKLLGETEVQMDLINI